MVVTYAYNTNTGRLSGKTNGNGTYTIYGYDAASNLTSIVNHGADGGSIASPGATINRPSPTSTTRLQPGDRGDDSDEQ